MLKNAGIFIFVFWDGLRVDILATYPPPPTPRHLVPWETLQGLWNMLSLLGWRDILSLLGWRDMLLILLSVGHAADFTMSVGHVVDVAMSV